MKTVKKRSQFRLPKKRIKFNSFEQKDEHTYLMFDLKGNSTLIDSDDLLDVQKFYWYKHPTTKYWISNSNYKELRLHRFIMDCPKDFIVDHLHHNLDDHRKSELMVCSYSQNNSNRKYSDMKNIQLTKSGNYEVAISVKGKLIRFGTYSNIEEAITIRDSKRKELGYAKC